MKTLNMIEFRWIRRSANVLADTLTNEGVNREGNVLDEVWSIIPRGQLRSDCIHLVEQDHGGSFRDDHQIGEDAGLFDPTWDPGSI
jgi:hypothetical protein